MECVDAVWERMAPEAVKALWWRRIAKAGYPLTEAGLGLWDLWLVSLVEEIENEQIDSDNR